MAKYSVSFHATASFVAEVEADSEEEALDLSYEEIPSLCWSCSSIDLGDFQLDEDDEYDGFTSRAIQLVKE